MRTGGRTRSRTAERTDARTFSRGGEDNLLLEDGFDMLQEDGSFLLLE